MDIRVQTGPLPGALCCVTHQAGALEAVNVGELCGRLHLLDTLPAMDASRFSQKVPHCLDLVHLGPLQPQLSNDEHIKEQKSQTQLCFLVNPAPFPSGGMTTS